MPQILQYGVATEDEIALETFAQRYREEVLSQGSVIQWLHAVGAWARKRPPNLALRQTREASA